MRQDRQLQAGGGQERHFQPGVGDSRQLSVRVGLIAAVTAVVVALTGGGEAFWLSLPAALLACSLCRTRTEAFVSTAVVVGAAAVPLTGWLAVGRVPSPLLTLLVVAASVGILMGVRERLEREHEALRNVALTDPLTGIPNRRLLLSRAEYEIARHRRARRRFAVVMLDLDGFKPLNDRFGHAAGDELLCDVATALTRAMRAQDTVARLGGDEFCVLAPETDGPHTLPLARRISETVAEATAGVETLSASVGVAIFPEDGVSATALLHAADERLLSAKRSRGGRVSRRAA
jgi:diguanylate cyclase (GGDEF)-like protein